MDFEDAFREPHLSSFIKLKYESPIRCSSTLILMLGLHFAHRCFMVMVVVDHCDSSSCYVFNYFDSSHGLVIITNHNYEVDLLTIVRFN